MCRLTQCLHLEITREVDERRRVAARSASEATGEMGGGSEHFSVTISGFGSAR